MKNTVPALLVLLLLGMHRVGAHIVASLDDIQNWTGTGSNRSALVLQWNDGIAPVSFAWGYRWDAYATGIQLLTAIAGTTIIRGPAGGETITGLTGADPSLTLTIERYDWGDAIYSMAYSGGGFTRTQADWEAGYWEYLVFGGAFAYEVFDSSWKFVGTSTYAAAGSGLYSAVDWFSSPIGASARELVDGSWDAYSFAPASTPQAVAQPSAAPPVAPRLSCSISGRDVSIAFSSEVGLTYLLLHSDNMDGAWSAMGDAVTGDGGNIVFVDTLPSEPARRPGRRFYKVVVTR